MQESDIQTTSEGVASMLEIDFAIAISEVSEQVRQHEVSKGPLFLACIVRLVLQYASPNIGTSMLL